MGAKKLFYKDTHIGNITLKPDGDFPWAYGNFAKSENFENFKEFFAFYRPVTEKIDSDISKFDENLFDEGNWTIRDESKSEAIGIYTPYVFEEDNHIGFRYYMTDNDTDWNWLE